MAVHDWQSAPPGLFHHFHQRWSTSICDALNAGLLPPGYYALLELTALGVEPDVLTMHRRRTPRPPDGSPTAIALAEAPPRTEFSSQSSAEQSYAARANRVTIRDAAHEVVATIEIVSPGNKGSRKDVKLFVEKALDLLSRGTNLLIVDLFPPTRRDPGGLNAMIWNDLLDDPFVLPADRNLVAASFVAGSPLRGFAGAFRIGGNLPDMPLFLDPEMYLQVPLEATYDATWRICPEEFRELVIGPPPDASAPAEGAL